jgi:phosphoglycolate phosphatase
MHQQNTVTPKAVIFDLDGTLIDSIADIADCSNAVLSNNGFPTIPVERFKELVGDGFSNLTRKILPESALTAERIAQFIAEYRSLYRERWNLKTTVYDGVHDLLVSLQNSGLILSVLSNKRDEATKLCVSWFFPEIRFVEVRGERDGTPLKPAPDAALTIAESCRVAPNQCIFVGDSEIDIETGLRAGMTSVGVLWGFRPRSVLEAAGAAHLIAQPTELLKIVEETLQPAY